jgi:hypothetical protein
MKAQVATIDLGFTQFDGLMLPDGQYAIAVPQAADLFERSRSVASRDFKRLLGARFESSKMTTEFNQAPVNVISISVFRLLVRELDKQGNQIATALVDAFFEESIERRFDTAFEKKVSETEYNQRLVLRMSRLMARHAWTDILRDRHIQIFGAKPSPNQFKQWTIKANQVLFHRDHFNGNRDNMELEEQRIIESFEFMAVRRANQNPNATPNQLLTMALDTF